MIHKRADFIVAYERSNNVNLEMDLRGAFVNICALFKVANKILNRGNVKIDSKVTEYEEGSCYLTVETRHNIFSKLFGIITGSYYVSAHDLERIVWGDLFFLLGVLEGDQLYRITKPINNKIRIEYKGSMFLVSTDGMRLYKDSAVKKILETILTPLRNESIHSFKVKEKEGKTIVGMFKIADKKEDVDVTVH